LGNLVIENPKYWVDVKPILRKTEYTKNDYMYWEATLYHGERAVAGEYFYPDYIDIGLGDYRESDIEDWAHRKMMVDKAARNEVESYRIDLEEE